MRTTTNCCDKLFKAGPTGISSGAVKVIGFFIVITLSLPWLFQKSDSFNIFTWTRQNSALDDFVASLRARANATTDPLNDAPTDGSVAKLIYDIREAVKLASGGSNESFSAEDRKAWEDNFPCRSRVELEGFYQKRKHVQYVPLNQQWQEVLGEYAVLHRVCMSRVGDLKNYFITKNESTGCKFLIAEAHYGLGNKILHISSLLMYAVLSQRVILIPELTFVPHVVCEPFPGSSWLLRDEIHRAVIADRRNSGELYAALDKIMSRDPSMPIYASEGGDVWGPEKRFWCNTEQSMFSTVTWLTIDGCLHSLPKLFAIAKFRPILEQIFPTRIVMTQVLRTAMLPADPVWERTVSLMNDHLAGAEKQVGVQLRYLFGQRQYLDSNERINERITRCSWENGFLPEVCPETTPENSAASDAKFINCSSTSSSSLLDADASPPTTAPLPMTKVLIASLVAGFQDHLQSIYRDRQTVDREIVSIVQPTHEEVQRYGVDVDRQALAEVMALSFSDALLVTPFSTFGGLAQAYGFLVPYFIEYRSSETKVPCQQGLSTEPCYLGGVANYDCRYDPPKSKSVYALVPYLQSCMAIDLGDGFGTLMMNDKLTTQSLHS